MPVPGKNAAGLKGFPTPNDIPDDNGYIVFRFPNNNEWAGLVLGAVGALSKEYNFYEWGVLTPAEAAEAFKDIVDIAPFNTCGCTRPGGGKILRMGYGGHFEELGDDGEWHDPTADYAIPAVPAREGGTSEDQKCLAAANATNVLQLLYENLSDSWAATLSTAEAQTAFLLGVAALIAAPFGLIGEAIVAIAGLVFEIAYKSLEEITADLWDSTFTTALQCILLGCATNTDGVVTFDLDCVNNQLAAQTNIFDLTATQLRLFGQLQWIFSMIGVDGLNSAGATTAITDADCSDCNVVHCFTIDLTESDGSAHGISPLFATDTWVPGSGWQSHNYGSEEDVTLLWTFPSPLLARSMSCEVFRQAGSGFDSGTNLNLKYPDATYASTTVQSVSSSDNGLPPDYVVIVATSFADTLGAGLTVDCNTGDEASVCFVRRVSIRYVGDEVFGGDNC